MAKIVIAGRADCPYYARAELLGDKLQKNLPDFSLHKIVKTSEEWEEWLTQTCNQRGWSHIKSPLVWRELIDRGGKGVLIGGANEFQEYAAGYYGQSSDLCSLDMRQIAAENKQTKVDIEEEERLFKSQSNPLCVCISNAHSNISYGMINNIAKGDVFGKNTEISLHLLTDDTHMEYMAGVEMESQDLAQGLLREVTVTSNVYQAFSDCSVILLLDEVPRDSDTEQEEWLKKNAKLFSSYAKIINEVAKPNVKVMLTGQGPVNFNTFMMIQNAPDIPRQNFVGLSRMVENHAKSVLATRLNVNSVNVVDVIVWGNTNNIHYIDLSKARVHNYDGAVWGPPSFSLPVLEMIHDNRWAEKEFPDLVEQRRDTVETNLGHPATMSQAAAIATMVEHWWNGSPDGQIFSLAVASEGWYGVPEGLVFSYPVTLNPKGYWNVVQDIDLTEARKDKIEATVQPLLSEKYVMFPPSKPSTPPPPAVVDTEPNSNDVETKSDDVETKSDEKTEEVALEKPREGGDDVQEEVKTSEEASKAE